MAELFKVLAGRSDDHFTLGGISFEAAPLVIEEYAEYISLPDGLFDVKAEFYAAKLRARVRGTKTDPANITPEWVMSNLPVSMMAVLDHVLIHGRMPESGEKKAGA